VSQITHVISSPEGMGGAEHVLASIVRAAAAAGWEQRVLRPFASPADGGELAEALAPVPLVAHPCSSPLAVPSTLRWLRAQMAAARPTIVHAHLFHAEIAVAAIPTDAARVLTHHHGSLLQVDRRWMRLALELAALRRYRRVFAVSAAVEEFLTGPARLDPVRVVRILNGWHGTPRPRAPAHQPTIVAIGNLRPEKDHATLVRAFAIVRRVHQGARLEIVGDGPCRRELEALASQLGVSAATKLTGAVADVWPHLAAAHVFALPSRSEALGIAAQEAMAAGLPVVGSAVGGIPELVEEGRTGRLVPPGDAAALAEAIIELLNQPLLAGAMGAEGRQRAATMRADQMAGLYLQHYRDLLAVSGGVGDVREV
jgi:glycosyltransferase involved in cell wall biosynthesis